jgi:hypothetical protein
MVKIQDEHPPMASGFGAHSASRDADEAVARDISVHHAAMVDTLDRLTAAVRDAEPTERARARQRLLEWFDAVLVPHADEEETTTYRAAAEMAEGRLFITAMVREHLLIKRLVALLAAADIESAAAYGRAIFEVFNSHQAKENDLILPMLVQSPQVSLVDVLAGAHGHQAGEHAHHHEHH